MDRFPSPPPSPISLPFLPSSPPFFLSLPVNSLFQALLSFNQVSFFVPLPEAAAKRVVSSLGSKSFLLRQKTRSPLFSSLDGLERIFHQSPNLCLSPFSPRGYTPPNARVFFPFLLPIQGGPSTPGEFRSFLRTSHIVPSFFWES